MSVNREARVGAAGCSSEDWDAVEAGELWFQEQPRAKTRYRSPCAVLLFLDMVTSPPEVEPHVVNIASHYEKSIAFITRSERSAVFGKSMRSTSECVTHHLSARATTPCNHKLSFIKLYRLYEVHELLSVVRHSVSLQEPRRISSRIHYCDFSTICNMSANFTHDRAA